MNKEGVFRVVRFEDHVHRAKSNLEVLAVLNRYAHLDYSWQVTLCFYTAVHLINSHLLYSAGETFKTHVSTLDRIDPGSAMNVNAVSLTAFKAYLRLHNRSREARYLCKVNDSGHVVRNHQGVVRMKHRHLIQCVSDLDAVLIDFTSRYPDAVTRSTGFVRQDLYLNGRLGTAKRFFQDIGPIDVMQSARTSG